MDRAESSAATAVKRREMATTQTPTPLRRSCVYCGTQEKGNEHEPCKDGFPHCFQFNWSQIEDCHVHVWSGWKPVLGGCESRCECGAVKATTQRKHKSRGSY